MHAYLGAIGFSDIHSHRSMDLLNGDVVVHCDDKYIYRSEDGRMIGEYSRCYAKNAGLTVVGEIDADSKFHPEFSSPFFRGENISTTEEVTIERRIGTEAFSGACDDARVGVTLIFYLINGGQYRLSAKKDVPEPGERPVILSALVKSGTVLLPLHKDREMERINRRINVDREKLVNAARDGDEEAMESLTMSDIDLYSSISERLNDEDIMSIVDSYFMPYGMECDQYSILGTIKSCEALENIVTNEKLWKMKIECNDMVLDVCVNAADLLGVPEVNRRFKGIIWLLGYVFFNRGIKGT